MYKVHNFHSLQFNWMTLNLLSKKYFLVSFFKNHIQWRFFPKNIVKTLISRRTHYTDVLSDMLIAMKIYLSNFSPFFYSCLQLPPREKGYHFPVELWLKKVVTKIILLYILIKTYILSSICAMILSSWGLTTRYTTMPATKRCNLKICIKYLYPFFSHQI